MVGKKKTFDVQFCTEVMEVSQALDGRRYDHDELEEEQRERQMRQRLNTEFQNFVKKVEELANMEFDMPYRDLGFHGVPHRSSVFLQPTVHCLVNLTEIPFFVLTLSNVEIAYFERVQV
jgi:nucleosome binding factor SPN SPT16 subunit